MLCANSLLPSFNGGRCCAAVLTERSCKSVVLLKNDATLSARRSSQRTVFMNSFRQI